MKKTFVALASLIFVNLCFSQESVVNRCSGFLGKPVPKEFSRQDRTTYSGFIVDDAGDEHQVQLFVSNGIVYASVYGAIADYTHEALEWLSQFYNYFEDNNWQYSEEESDTEADLYIKNSIYAILYKPTKRDDGMIVAVVLFTKKEYQDMF